MRRTVAALTFLVGAVGGAWLASAAPVIDSSIWAAVGVDRPAQPMPAPPVRGVDLDGRAVSLESFRGRVVMLYFWATW